VFIELDLSQGSVEGTPELVASPNFRVRGPFMCAFVFCLREKSGVIKKSCQTLALEREA